MTKEYEYFKEKKEHKEREPIEELAYTPLMVLILFFFSNGNQYKKFYINQLARLIKVSYGHLNKIASRLVKYRLLDVERKGWVKYLFLTEKGMDISTKFFEINCILKEAGRK